MKWYAKKTNAGSAHEQGLIADEDTGRSVAVCYDSKDMNLLAAAPELLAAMEDCAGVLQSIEDQLHGKSVAVVEVLKQARAAIAKAKGGE